MSPIALRSSRVQSLHPVLLFTQCYCGGHSNANRFGRLQTRPRTTLDFATLPYSATAPRVVVAEDDPDLRNMICDVLRADGYHVDVACDGRELTALVEAVIRADGRPPEMIISDVRMPGRTGLEALALLQPS